VEPAVRVIGPLHEGEDAGEDAEPADVAAAAEGGAPPTAAPSAPVEVPLIDDGAPAARRAPVAWDAAAAGDRKPLLTRAQPLDRGAPGLTAMRIGALLLVVAVLVVLALLLL
jgi:hypothetical protein